MDLDCVNEVLERGTIKTLYFKWYVLIRNGFVTDELVMLNKG
jgi:hypothetical protein